MYALVVGLSPGAVTWRSQRFPAIEENVMLGFEHLDRRLVTLFEALRHVNRIQMPVPLQFARPGEPEPAEKRVITDPAELAAKFAALSG